MKVGLVGLSCIVARGMKSVIEETCPGWDVSIYNIENPGWQEANCHIVSAAAMAAMARFLMPRLDRVLLVSSSAYAESPIPMLSPSAPEPEVRKALKGVLSHISDDGESASRIPLTPRELEVLKLTAAGDTSKQIADKLCISQNTVLTHRKNIAAKTGLRSVSAITHFAMIHGLLH